MHGSGQPEEEEQTQQRERLEIAQDQYLASSQGLPGARRNPSNRSQGSPLPGIPRHASCLWPSPPSTLPVPALWKGG